MKIYIFKKIGYSVKWYSNTIRIKIDYSKNDILNEFIGSPKWELKCISSLDDKTPEETLRNKTLPEYLTFLSDDIDRNMRKYSKLNTKKDEEKFFCKAHLNHIEDKDWEIKEEK